MGNLHPLCFLCQSSMQKVNVRSAALECVCVPVLYLYASVHIFAWAIFMFLLIGLSFDKQEAVSGP